MSSRRLGGITPLVLCLCLIASLLPTFARPTSARAQEEPQPQEVETLRTKYSSTFENGDGTWTEVIHLNPIHYKDAEGEWEEIDTTLVPNGDGTWRNKAGAFTSEFAASADDATLVSLEQDDAGVDSAVDLGVPGLDGSENAVIEGNTITYPSVLPNVDMRLSVLATGVEQFFVFNEAPEEAQSFRIPMDLSGLTAKEASSGDIKLKDTDGKTELMIPDLWMWDSSGASDHIPVGATLQKSGGDAVLTINPDQEWLSDPARVFPVIVDPALTQPDFNDTYVRKFSNNTADTSSHEQATNMKVGTHTSQNSMNARMLMHFNLGTAQGQDITDAKLKLWETFAPSCNGTNVAVHRITSDWNATTVNWTSPISGGGVNFAATALATVNAAKGASGCPAGLIGDFNVTQTVQDWSAGTTTNYGLLVKAPDETNTAQYKEFASRNLDGPTQTGTDPKLEITYNRPPTVSTGLLPTDGRVTNGLPSLQAVYNDPDAGDSGVLRYEVYLTGAFVSTNDTRNCPRPRHCAARAMEATPERSKPGRHRVYRTVNTSGE